MEGVGELLEITNWPRQKLDEILTTEIDEWKFVHALEMKKREKTGRTYQRSTPAIYQWTRTYQNLNISLCLAFFLPSWTQNIRGVRYPAACDGLWRKTVQGNQAAKLAISPLHLVNTTLQFRTKHKILLGEYLCISMFFYHNMYVWYLFWLDFIDNRRQNLCFGPKKIRILHKWS
jgi:hypothetical protein